MELYSVMRITHFGALLFFSFIFSRCICHAFEVSIETFNSLPVTGENFTLVCTFTPQTGNRVVAWQKSTSINTPATHSCRPSYGCQSVVPNSKFSLFGGHNSVNLTINDITTDDSDIYKCTVSTTHGTELLGSASTEVSALLPVPPQWLTIRDDTSNRYVNNSSLTVTVGEHYAITCESRGARPPAVLDWKLPTNISAVVGSQSDVVQGDIFVSKRVATIIPSRNDQGKSLRCVSSHPELTQNLERLININIQVVPTSLQLTFCDHNSENQNVKSATVYAYENSSTSFTCKSIGSLPAAELSWTLAGISPTPDFNNSEYPNSLDGDLFDSESTIRIRLKRKHHRQFLVCYASLWGLTASTLLKVYDPPDEVAVMTSEELQDGLKTNVSCRAHNGSPAPLIHWYIGSRNLTENSSRTVSLIADGRYDVESTMYLIPKRSDNGKRLVCQAVQLKTSSLRPVTASLVLNISFHPDSPFDFVVDRNQTTSSALFVAWQPELNILQQCPAPETSVETFLSKHKSVLLNTKL